MPDISSDKFDLAELSYRPSSAAHGLARGSLRSVAVILPDPHAYGVPATTRTGVVCQEKRSVQKAMLRMVLTGSRLTRPAAPVAEIAM